MSKTIRRLHGIQAFVCLLGAIDLVVLVGAPYVGVATFSLLSTRTSDLPTIGEIGFNAAILAALTMLFLACVGLYRRRQRPRFREILSRCAVATLLGICATLVVVKVLQLAVPPAPLLEGGVLAGTILFAIVGLSAGRWVLLRAVDANPLKRRVVVFGSGWAANKVGMLRRRSDRRYFDILGYVPTSDRELRLARQFKLQPILEVADVDLQENLDEIVVAADDRRGALATEDFLGHKAKGIEVTDIVSFLERETGLIELDVLRPDWLLFTKFKAPSASVFVATKRLFDLVVATAMLLLAAPLIILAAAAIKIEDGLRAPIFYAQRRVGLNGGYFKLLKFRSMIVDAESHSGPKWSPVSGDDRVTKVGKILRRYRIDELPQLLNVVRGQMSIVGPRPERPEFVAELRDKIPFYDLRHSVRPGVTGWAQLSFPYGASVEDARVKHKYDLYYIKNASLLLDMSLLLQTFEVVLWGRALGMAGHEGEPSRPTSVWSRAGEEQASPAVKRDVA